MKTKFTQYAVVFISVMLFAACTKQGYVSGPTDEQEWMRTHDKGEVAYVDNYTGNYIVETYEGYSVMGSRGGIVPRQYDNEYAWFNNAGTQSVYNYNGNYYTKEVVVASWLTWSDALTVLDNIGHGQ